MFAFLRNLVLAVIGIAMFVWLLTMGVVIALILLVLGLGVYIYLQLVRRGILNPPSRWAQYRHHQATQEDVIEVEYAVVEEEEGEEN